MGQPTVADLFPQSLLAATAALVRTSIAVGAAINRAAVEPADLEPATADLMVRLAVSPGNGLRGVEIARQLRIGPTRVSRLIDRAESAGLVQRTPDPHDRRAQYVVLTQSGEEAARRYAPLMADVIDQIIMRTLSSAEQRTFVELLDRVSDAADAVEEVGE